MINGSCTLSLVGIIPRFAAAATTPTNANIDRIDVSAIVLNDNICYHQK